MPLSLKVLRKKWKTRKIGLSFLKFDDNRKKNLINFVNLRGFRKAEEVREIKSR